MIWNTPAVPTEQPGCKDLNLVYYTDFDSWNNVSRWWSLVEILLPLIIVIYILWIYSKPSDVILFLSELLNMSQIHCARSWGGSGSQIPSKPTIPILQDLHILISSSESIFLSQLDFITLYPFLSQLDPQLPYVFLSMLITYGCYAAIYRPPYFHLIPWIFLAGFPKYWVIFIPSIEIWRALPFYHGADFRFCFVKRYVWIFNWKQWLCYYFVCILFQLLDRPFEVMHFDVRNCYPITYLLPTSIAQIIQVLHNTNSIVLHNFINWVIIW